MGLFHQIYQYLHKNSSELTNDIWLKQKKTGGNYFCQEHPVPQILCKGNVDSQARPLMSLSLLQTALGTLM